MVLRQKMSNICEKNVTLNLDPKEIGRSRQTVGSYIADLRATTQWAFDMTDRLETRPEIEPHTCTPASDQHLSWPVSSK